MHIPDWIEKELGSPKIRHGRVQKHVQSINIDRSQPNVVIANFCRVKFHLCTTMTTLN